ncbi:MAG: Hsp20/alpha crystallin family protein [Desulfuromonadaceae bacterium]|jgi:HSP20 family protein
MANWDIVHELENLRREIDDVFHGFGTTRGLGPAFLPRVSGREYPCLNLSEDENNLYVEALVPGLEPQHIDLNVMRGSLTIAGERKESGAAGHTWHRRERGSGAFLRSLELPVPVNTERVSAQYRNGILTITLPKVEEVKAKKIAVKIG